MSEDIIISIIFMISSALTIIFILKKPILFVRIGNRSLKLETYFFGALISPIVILSLGMLTLNQVFRSLSGERGIEPLGILILFFSMVFISIFLDITGFFEYCALSALKFAKTNGRRLFFSLYAIISLLTIFTSNDIVIITFTPFIYYLTKNAGINPKPYLIAEFFAANTWSMTLYIGNPTNILLASAFDLKFDQYFIWMILPTTFAGIMNFLLLYLLFKKDVNKSLQPIQNINPIDAITNKKGSIFGILLLIGCISALAVAPYFQVEMWVVALTCAIILLGTIVISDLSSLHKKKNNESKYFITPTVRRMPWTIIPFLLSLFITVEALRVHNIIGTLHSFFTSICGFSSTAYIFIYGITSALAANILNNQPMTVAFASIMFGTPEVGLLGAVLATTIGSNLGANITPIGALAGIMWMNILRSKDFKLTFKEFMRYGLIVTPITLTACLGVLSLEFLIINYYPLNGFDIITQIFNFISQTLQII